MSFIQFPDPTPVFPVLPPLEWSVNKKPIMASNVTKAITGRETQLARAVYPRWMFTLRYGNSSWLRDETQNIVTDPTLAGFKEMQQLSGLFLACRASYGEFYYNDPQDNSRSSQDVGTGDGVIDAFKLYFTWGFGPFTPTFTMPVMGINTMDVVYLNGTPISPSAYTLDATKTVLQFVTPPSLGDVITADFHFYFRCRFVEDKLEMSQWGRNLWQVKEVRFESVKP